jgi:hypothetical protein
VFCLVTNSSVREFFRFEDTGAYTRCVIVRFDREGSFEELLHSEIPTGAHILVVSPEVFFRSPSPDVIGRRKLIVMACNSTPTPVEAIARFLEVMERTDPQEQSAFAGSFLAAVESSQRLTFLEPSGATATLEHLGRPLEWNLQAGPLEWGEQQIAPSGEISVLPADITEFEPTLRQPIHGTIAFRGQPVLHSAGSETRAEQARLHAGLASLANQTVVATVRQGMITELNATHPDADAAIATLHELFETDWRYRIIWEIGFGINTAFTVPLPGNCAMNEVFGGTAGVVHWGLGLTPYTRYALILPSIHTRVLAANGVVALGSDELPAKPRMRRRVVGGCACHS